MSRAKYTMGFVGQFGDAEFVNENLKNSKFSRFVKKLQDF